MLTDEDLDADPPGHRSGYVAVIGKPNAGKSTLINAIVGQKLRCAVREGGMVVRTCPRLRAQRSRPFVSALLATTAS